MSKLLPPGAITLEELTALNGYIYFIGTVNGGGAYNVGNASRIHGIHKIFVTPDTLFETPPMVSSTELYPHADILLYPNRTTKSTMIAISKGDVYFPYLHITFSARIPRSPLFKNFWHAYAWALRYPKK
jgi:hypothetical protein